MTGSSFELLEDVTPVALSGGTARPSLATLNFPGAVDARNRFPRLRAIGSGAIAPEAAVLILYPQAILTDLNGRTGMGWPATRKL